ncbi:MAG: hypothetical protein C4K58_04385 [Flavobacteriaceae bacterium]|nr:MAG: hypothetical protein C4K58_04385 [Flavobacteriaceae bacterium]
MKHLFKLFLVLNLAFLTSCATYKTQISGEPLESQKFEQREETQILHTFYLIGDAGNSKMDTLSDGLKLLREELQKDKNSASTLLFLGDNIYPAGLPKEDDPTRELAEYRLLVQLKIAQNSNSKSYFIPGNHDWYAKEGTKREREYVDKTLGEHSFLPLNGAFFTRKKISDKIELIVIDSEKFITHQGLNQKMLAYQSLKQEIAQIPADKTLIVASHHPLFSSGEHGGKFSFKDHIFPLSDKIPMPLLGSLVVASRQLGIASNTDLAHKKYKDFRENLLLIFGERPLYFVAGHEHILELIQIGDFHQITSGAGSKSGPSKLGKHTMFTSSNQGFATLTLLEGNRAEVKFISIDKNGIQSEHSFLVSALKD